MKQFVYRFSDNMAFEAFEDGALILQLSDLTFFELNKTARDILKLTNGQNDLLHVAQLFADDYQIDLETALEDVNDLYTQLSNQGIIEQILMMKG